MSDKIVKILVVDKIRMVLNQRRYEMKLYNELKAKMKAIQQQLVDIEDLK